MKTLDEVIKACEETVSDVDRGVDIEGCYLGATETRDALHYLRELKLFRQTPIMQGIHKAQRECALYPVSDFGEDEFDFNPPLTWSQLRQMEGKHVWVEALLYNQWAVIAYVGDEHIRFEGVNLYAPESRIYMGDDGWQAYRKERNEDAG